VVLARATRRNIAAGALGYFYGMIVLGAFQTGFAEALGLTKVQFGYMSAIPLIVFPARLLGSYIVEHLGRRKMLFSVTAILARLVWVLILLLPFILTDVSPFRSRLFLCCLLLASAIGVMSEPAWFSWMGDLIPDRMRSRFWSKRSTYIHIIFLVPSVLIALLKDTLDSRLSEGSAFIGFSIVFAFAVLCGVVDIIIHYGIPEPPMVKPEKQSRPVAMLLKPVSDTRFRPFLLFRAVWVVSLMLLGPFGTLHLLDVLGGRSYSINAAGIELYAGPYTIIAVFLATQIAAGIVCYPIWNVLLERYGSKPVMQLCSLMAVFSPAPWLFITRDTIFIPTALLFVYSGITFSGLEIATLNLMLGLAPKQHRSMYVAVDLTVVGLFGAVGPIIAGYFMQYAQGLSLNFMSRQLGSFHLLVIACCLLRLYARTLLYRVEEGSGVSSGYIFRRIFEGNPIRVFPNIYILSGPASEESKISAVSRLGASRSKLALQDLLSHLDDPSPYVREEAVLAIAKSRDTKTIGVLIEKLRNRDISLHHKLAGTVSKIAREMKDQILVDALRELGFEGEATSRVAGGADNAPIDVGPLIESLSHPDPTIRASAAHSLGQVGDRRASEPLYELLQNEQDEHAFGFSAHAISALGEISAIWLILPVMRNTKSVTVRRQLAVAIGNLLGKPKEFYGHLDEECKVSGQSVCRIFGRCGRLVNRSSDDVIKENRRRLLKLIDEAEALYLQSDWTGCATGIVRITSVLIDALFARMAAVGEIPPDVEPEDLGVFEKIFLIIAVNEQLGMQLWYAEILNAGKDPEFPKLTFEGCLLDIYVLEQIMKQVLAE